MSGCLSPRMTVGAPAAVAHISGMGGGCLILCSPPTAALPTPNPPPPTAGGGATSSSAATVETFSIMSAHQRALECSARGLAETCAEATAEELRSRKAEQISNAEVS